jgi:hypothetical protein
MKKMFVFVLLFASPYVMAAGRVPVMVGGSDDLDACKSVGIVKAANGVGGAHVRMGPSEEHLIFGFLKDGKQVWMCSHEGDWVGVVYPSKDEACGVSGPINPEQPYEGKCKSGWVHESDMEPVAG